MTPLEPFPDYHTLPIPSAAGPHNPSTQSPNQVPVVQVSSPTSPIAHRPTADVAGASSSGAAATSNGHVTAHSQTEGPVGGASGWSFGGIEDNNAGSVEQGRKDKQPTVEEAEDLD